MLGWKQWLLAASIVSVPVIAAGLGYRRFFANRLHYDAMVLGTADKLGVVVSTFWEIRLTWAIVVVSEALWNLILIVAARGYT